MCKGLLVVNSQIYSEHNLSLIKLQPLFQLTDMVESHLFAFVQLLSCMRSFLVVNFQISNFSINSKKSVLCILIVTEFLFWGELYP